LKKFISAKTLVSILVTAVLVCCQKEYKQPRRLSSLSFDTGKLNEGLVAYFPFRADLLDHSNNGHNGVAVSTISFGKNHLDKSEAALVLGTGRVVTDTFFNLQRTDSFSVCMWFKLNSDRGGGRLISTECPEGNFRIAAFNDGIYCFQYGACWIYDTVQLNEWNYLVYTCRNKDIKIYKNGVLKYQGVDRDTKRMKYCAPFTIGAKASPGYDLWQGSIESLRIYNRAISQAQVNYMFKHSE